MNVPTPADVRFWAKVERHGAAECWPWQGSRSSRGYGQFYAAGRTRPAHVVAWELTNGEPFPTGMDGCHKCDNPPCVNPAHIFPGTPSDNQLDSIRKGRRVYSLSTHCPAGHSYDYLHVNSRGHREQVCVTCRRANERRRWHARKSVAA